MLDMQSFTPHCIKTIIIVNYKHNSCCEQSVSHRFWCGPWTARREIVDRLINIAFVSPVKREVEIFAFQLFLSRFLLCCLFYVSFHFHILNLTPIYFFICFWYLQLILQVAVLLDCQTNEWNERPKSFVIRTEIRWFCAFFQFSLQFFGIFR